jgi:hypothetical protein
VFVTVRRLPFVIRALLSFDNRLLLLPTNLSGRDKRHSLLRCEIKGDFKKFYEEITPAFRARELMTAKKVLSNWRQLEIRFELQNQIQVGF